MKQMFVSGHNITTKRFVNHSVFHHFIVFILILILVFQIPLGDITVNAKHNLDISLDYNEIDGMIQSYGQINCGPLPNINNPDGAELSAQYGQTGFDLIRTHDIFGPTDISTIFPDFSADPYDPNSYNFTETDRQITSIIESGCNVFYRLGESASDNDSLRQPPSDFHRWAEICKHIIMHYNDRWCNGFQYNISYFEIWNEPDLSGFWNGTAEQYYQLYKITAETIKSYDPALKVGGPCTSSIDNINFTSGFLSFVRENNVPLDFYSWHRYADSPYHLYQGGCFVRSLLDEYGFTDVESINTEWNINLIYPQRDNDNAKNAAFTAASLSIFQDAGIDKSFRYRGPQDNNWLMKFIGFDVSLFTLDGIFKTPALSYLAMNTLCKETPYRLSTDTLTGESGLTLLAGISEDKTNISILISNYEGETTNLEITLDNIPRDISYSFVQYCIDEKHHFQIIQQIILEPDTSSLSITIPPSTVYFIRLTNSTVIPDEGPEVASIPWLLRSSLFDPLAKLLAIWVMLFFFS
jgi:xylan 1,4-beta-xylosidase